MLGLLMFEGHSVKYLVQLAIQFSYHPWNFVIQLLNLVSRLFPQINIWKVLLYLRRELPAASLIFLFYFSQT